MASHKSPLRDRLLSNSPDPIKSSILRESGMGWNSSATTSPPASGSAGSITSPLRIAKRDSPGRPKGPSVARRTSSSYRHVQNGNLVSKSPFKSQIPAPATPSRPTSVIFPTRRVSGEKRPRPSSMHDLAEVENDRPAALKRDRKQSKAFQGLLEKEPVTRSPFKVQQHRQPAQQQAPAVEMKSAPIPIPMARSSPQLSSTPPEASHLSTPAAPSSGGHSPGRSPGRSALVSRRMHGPRLSGGAKRERRKTVTFHERCDVLEFDREDDTDEDVFQDSDEDDNEGSRSEARPETDTSMDSSMTSNTSNQDHDQVMEDDASYESIQLSDGGFNPPVPSLLADPDASITGIVEEMFFSSNAANLLSDTSITSNVSTPPRHHDIPTDLETEDGIPFGRSHHVERLLQHKQHHSPQTHPPLHFSPRNSPSQHVSPKNQGTPTYPYNFNLSSHSSPHGSPATPPRRSPALRHSTPPLGRSTHAERVRQAREEEKEQEQDAEDVEKLPGSPSPMKRALPAIPSHEETLIPRFDLRAELSTASEPDQSTEIDIPAHSSRIQDQSALSGLTSEGDSSLHLADPSNSSMGNSEVNTSVVSSEQGLEEVLQNLEATPVPKASPLRETPPRHASPSMAEYYSGVSRRVGSPIPRSGSPLLAINSRGTGIAKTSSRERISREEVQRRLLNQRSPRSPSPDNNHRRSNLSPQPTIFIASADTTAEERSKSQSPLSLSEKEENRLSILTTQTDFSTETAIVETAEKRNLGMTMLDAPGTKGDSEFGLLGPEQRLHFDLGSRFSLGGLGLPATDTEVASIDSREDLRNPPHSARSIESTGSGMRMGDVDVDMEMKSALDRLMEDVAGAGAQADDSMMTDEYDDSYEQSQSHDDHDRDTFSTSRPKIMERAATDSVLLENNQADGIVSRTASGSSTITMEPPPLPPKDNIKSREQLILEKRREARRLEQGDFGPPPVRGKDQQHLGVGRPSRRRSMSTNDAETIAAKARGELLLDVVGNTDTNDDPLADSIEKELQKLVEAPKKSQKYHVREREGTIYASSSEEKVSHMAGPGDVDAGRAWRTVRRPSDMNEYAKQIREYRSQDKGKAYGKVFVKVLGIRGLNLPMPQEPTAFTCTLNNGIHFVTTPECQLAKECRVDQEFELIEHSKLEFTLTLKVRRDPHIIAQFRAVGPAPVPPAPAPRPPLVAQSSSKSGGMRSFFSSSPKKLSKEKIIVQPPPPLQPQPVQRLTENLARHLKPDGTLARAFVSFKDVASRCDTRLFETSYPLIGQRVELGGKFSTLEVGEIVLQLFRLPPLPGIPQDQLPQSLEECIRGLRHINWHKVTYFQGTLTQSGGDCSTWRRRQLRVIGANLVAFNDVTKKATATIDLKKAIAVEDDQEARNNARSPASGTTSRYADEYDGLYGVERSFRLIFPQDQEILFFADTDEEKAKWQVKLLEVLRALVGRIPPHPLWAELLWQRQEEISKRMAAAQHTIAPSSPPDSSTNPRQR